MSSNTVGGALQLIGIVIASVGVFLLWGLAVGLLATGTLLALLGVAVERDA